MDHRGMVEAALFSAGKAVSIGEIARATGLEEGNVRKALRVLRKAYRMRETALEIVKIGPKFSLQLKEDYVRPTQEIARKELDRNTLKVAALIAYYQPMTKKDLVEMAGPKAWEHAKLLQKIGLVLIRRRGPGYALETGQRFLEYFGIAAKRREEIKRILAEKAGVTEQPEEAPDTQKIEEMPRGS